MVLHRWTALVVGVFIIILGLSGSALVFEGAIDRAQRPDLWHVTPGGRWLSLDSLVASARSAMPGFNATLMSLPAAVDRAATVQLGPNQVFVDPYSGRVEGQRSAAESNASLPRRLHLLHVSLLSGRVGGDIVGIATSLALFLVLSGVIIWWRDKLWRINWSASWKRIVFDLHHSLGVFASLIIALIAASGMVIHYKPLEQGMRKLGETPAPEARAPSTPARGAQPISIDSVYAVALRALPGAQASFITLPPKGNDPALVAMKFPEDRTPAGRSRVLVDRYTGAVLLASSTRGVRLGSWLGNTIRSIHTGDLFGRPTEMIWLAAALIMATQALTGTTMWWNGRAARAALARAARKAA